MTADAAEPDHLSANLYSLRIFRDNGCMNGQNDSSDAMSALLSFTARNVRSYREEVHLSLLATRLSDTDAVRDVDTAGASSPVTVLPVAGIFGANASGKSTVLRAMADMRAIVLGSFRQGDHETRIRRYPFLLHDESACPSHFEVDLILSGVRWQYGFEFDDRHVLGEYAYFYPKGRQALVFRRERDRQEHHFGQLFRSSGPELARLVRRNALLLSVAGAAADATREDRPRIVAVLGSLFAWFRTSLLLMDSGNGTQRIARTADLTRSSGTRERVLALIRAADLGITDVERFHRDFDPELAERVQRALRILNGLEESGPEGQDDRLVVSDLIRLHHTGLDGSAAIDPEHESAGTLTWVSLIGPVLDALDRGVAVLVDDLDASLHPHLVQRFIHLFQDRDTNPKCAQLVFNAHDVTILGDSSQRALGRDQIWLTEKAADGTTTLYALADFRPKGDEALGRRYLQGRYGGVPVLDPAEFRQAIDATDS